MLTWQETHYDRQILANHVGEWASCFGVAITSKTTSRLGHKYIVGSIYTPWGQLDHLALNLSDRSGMAMVPFYVVHFRGLVYQYRDFNLVDHTYQHTYGIKSVKEVQTRDTLPYEELSTYQRLRARYYRVNFKDLYKLPNDGSRERYLAYIKADKKVTTDERIN